MKTIKMGIFGCNRGMDLANSILLNGAEIVAVCDKDERWLNKAKERLGDSTTYYTDFDEFIEHDLDAVLVANYFNEHAPFAIRLLEKGINVLSECTAAGTMAECVELVEAVQKSSAKYMICENYPFMKFNREIKRVVETGTLGKIMFAEGEYNHPGHGRDVSFAKRYIPYLHHWRNFLPAAYYCTHSLAPIMRATKAEPIRVTAFPVWAPQTEKKVTSKFCGDRTAIITTLNNDDSVFRITGCAAFGHEENSYRVCGTLGQVENLRGTGGKVSLNYSWWAKPENIENNCNVYEPKWNDKDEALIEKQGHGGGDFLVVREFLDCLREDRQPDMDVYFATKMSAVEILGHRSLMENGMPYDLPDFRNKEDRDKFRDDRLTPFYGYNGEEPTYPNSSKPYTPKEEQINAYLEGLKD